MLAVVLALALGAFAHPVKQVPNISETSAEQHIRNIIAELPADSALRRELESGAKGNGVHRSWMDDMRADGIRRAVVQFHIQFDRHGRAKHMAVKSIQLFKKYDHGTPVSDAADVSIIHSSGLEHTLEDLALERAAHGAWMDVPRPRPKPFDGGAQLEFFDDEWLPTQNVPLYCAGTSCFSSGSIQP
jgi:hypothetical protein